jgi:hypothetical protein
MTKQFKHHRILEKLELILSKYSVPLTEDYIHYIDNDTPTELDALYSTIFSIAVTQE